MFDGFGHGKNWKNFKIDLAQRLFWQKYKWFSCGGGGSSRLPIPSVLVVLLWSFITLVLILDESWISFRNCMHIYSPIITGLMIFPYWNGACNSVEQPWPLLQADKSGWTWGPKMFAPSVWILWLKSSPSLPKANLNISNIPVLKKTFWSFLSFIQKYLHTW